MPGRAGQAARERNAAAQRRRRERLRQAQREAEALRLAAERAAERGEAAADRPAQDGADGAVDNSDGEQAEAEREAARERIRERQRQRRAAMADAEREAEHLLDRERQRQRRADLPEEEREAERQQDGERQRQRRADLPEEERAARRAADAAAAARRRRAARERGNRSACDAEAVLSGRQQVAVQDTGQRNINCEHCGALRWPSERATLCCQAGKVRLEPVPAPPALLRRLWTEDDLLARTFREHSRRLNTALSLASMMTREVRPADGGYAPSVVIQGRLYHRLGPLEAGDGHEPSFAQIYVNDPACADPATEAAMRLGHVPLPRATSPAVRQRLLTLLEDLQLLLREVNPYVQDFILASELPEDQVDQQQLVISAEARPADQHRRRYNPAEGFREVAVLIGDEPVHQDIVLRRRAGADGPALQTINETHRAFEALHYVLLLPFGTDGWQPGLRHAVPNARGVYGQLTLTQYYAYRLQERPGMDDTLLRGARLLQEYVCMAFARVETQRLLWAARNQQAIRADLYQRLEDALPADALAEQREGEQRLGRRIILPASFTGGLPHSHILLIVRQEDRPRTADDVDAVISAELPDPTQSDQARRLHAIVVRSMVHRPCNTMRPAPACIINGRCDKGFPKPYAAVTEWRDDCPYIYKGPDRQMVRADALVGLDDEIAAYQDLRSIGASEACWRLFEEPISRQQPTVVTLQVHLPNQQLVYFEPGGEQQAIEAARRTQLTAWLEYTRGQIDMPAQLRRLFGVILLFCAPAAPMQLFERHLHDMAEDFVRRHAGLPDDLQATLVLLQLEEQLQQAGKQLDEFGLPVPTAEQRALAADLEHADAERRHLPRPIQEEMEHDDAELHDQLAAQLPVLLPHGSRAAVAGACLRRSPLWRHFVVAQLRTNMRARMAGGEDGAELEAFADWLLQLGDGRLPGPEDGFVQLPPELTMDADVTAVIDWVFDGLADHHDDHQWMASRAVLAPRNTRVDAINAAVTALFPGEE
ncbi:hypothetical protein FJT64_024766 [Amphibalanus amphitrite]|uniref:ATP-dependent DNA helicase n=1 Tax=Amphibalanus amphitrite TaxID=1232801 RepID=A0A6A4W798_AMPAM|nr:hypothetical protein FJT64_024766 [Amphibalanus amphitrite]